MSRINVTPYDTPRPRSSVRATEDLPHMTVDPETGAIYVYTRRGKVARTETLSTVDLINADYDADDNLIGVEIIP